jgi:hypothetical protein
MARPQPYLFVLDGWIPASPKGPTEITLTPCNVVNPEAEVLWKVTTRTADTYGSQLDAPAYIALFGDGLRPPQPPATALARPGTAVLVDAMQGHLLGQTGALELAHAQSGLQPFRRGAQDTFLVQARAPGKMLCRSLG